MKGIGGTKIVKGMKFEGVWGELESERGFQRHFLISQDPMS